jgi:hypothetical protein
MYMKKLILMAFGIALTTISFAQTTPKKEDEKHLRTDIRDKRQDNRAVTKDVTRLHLKDAKTDHQSVKSDKTAMHRNVTRLKTRGVKHPVVRAKHQIHSQDEAKKYSQ